MVIPFELYFLLLVVVIIFTWLLGRSFGLREAKRKFDGALSKHYFQGVNYLLNEQPDQAIDVFISSFEVAPHTLETHLSLGNLMRQKGEVERAIRVHQNLLSRPTLSFAQAKQAHLELGRDFLKAGLLDRAESLFLEIAGEASGECRQYALRYLVEIYRNEQEWEKAIRTASRIDKNFFGAKDNNLTIEQAHFCCELAEKAKKIGDFLDVRRYLKMALKFNRNSPRANILWGDLEMASSNFHQALKRYQLVPKQESAYIPEILSRVRSCYQQLDDDHGELKQLNSWFNEYPSWPMLHALVTVVRKREGEASATQFLLGHLEKNSSLEGLNVLLDLNIKLMDRAVRNESSGSNHSAGSEAWIETGARDNLLLLKSALATMVTNQSGYCCSCCGFKGKQLHWLCPQCQQWETIKPLHLQDSHN